MAVYVKNFDARLWHCMAWNQRFMVLQISNRKCNNTRRNTGDENVRGNQMARAASTTYPTPNINPVLSTKAILNWGITRTTAYSGLDTKLNCHYCLQTHSSLKSDMLRNEWSSGRFIHLFSPYSVCNKHAYFCRHPAYVHLTGFANIALNVNKHLHFYFNGFNNIGFTDERR